MTIQDRRAQAMTLVPMSIWPRKGVYQVGVVKKRYGATDGWINMPDGTVHYIFGFCDITDVPENEVFSYRGKATLLAPLLDVYEGDEIYLTLTNLGFPQRPDLDDTHTIHWHGFPNQISLWDGVPEASISVPVGRNFEYYYEPLDPGTYMYHCHFEPVEHIQMGMVGPLIVRPLIEKDPDYTGRKFAYNDISTEYDREAIIFVTEMDARPHHLVANVQVFDWTDYCPQYWMINGRAYPDTVKPPNDPSFPSQPYSAYIEGFTDEKVLLRFVNLGFENHSIQITGIPFKVIGLDAKQLKGLNGEDLSQWRNAVYVAPGQTVDAMITLPDAGKYILYNRSLQRNTNNGIPSGGMMTEINVLEV